MAISAIHKNNKRNHNEFQVWQREPNFIQCQERRRGKQVIQIFTLETPPLPPPKPQIFVYMSFYPRGPSYHDLFFPMYISYTICLFFLTVYTHTHIYVGYIQCGIFDFAHRYIPRVEDSTWYTAGTQQVLSGGKVFQVEGTANAKFLRQGTRRSMQLVDNRKGKNSRSKIRKSMWEGQKQGDNQEAITPVYVKKFELESSSRGSEEWTDSAYTLRQGLANFHCKESGSKYFWLCRP